MADESDRDIAWLGRKHSQGTRLICERSSSRDSSQCDRARCPGRSRDSVGKLGRRPAARSLRHRAVQIERDADEEMTEIDDALRRQVWFRDEGRCQICLTAIDSGDFHIDHVWPKSAGGPNELSNLRLAHPDCNLAKGALLPSSAEILRVDTATLRYQMSLDRIRSVTERFEVLAPQFEDVWSSGAKLPNGAWGTPERTHDWSQRLRRQLNDGLAVEELLDFARQTIAKPDIQGEMGHWKWFQYLCKQRREAIAAEAQRAVQPLNRASEMASLENLTQSPNSNSSAAATDGSVAVWRLSVELFSRPLDRTWGEVLADLSVCVPLNLVDGPTTFPSDWGSSPDSPTNTGREPLVLSGEGGPAVARQLIAVLTAMEVSFALNLHPPRGVMPLSYLFEPSIGSAVRPSDGTSIMMSAQQIDDVIGKSSTRDELVAALRDLTAWQWRRTLTAEPWHGGPSEAATLNPSSQEGIEFYGR